MQRFAQFNPLKMLAPLIRALTGGEAKNFHPRMILGALGFGLSKEEKAGRIAPTYGRSSKARNDWGPKERAHRLGINKRRAANYAARLSRRVNRARCK